MAEKSEHIAFASDLLEPKGHEVDPEPRILQVRRIELEVNDTDISMCGCHCISYCTCNCDRGGVIS